MESNQMVEGLARAMEAAKPAQEYCLLLLNQSWWSCLTKAEWAGWMQAIGAVVALAVAIYLPQKQKSDQRSENARLIKEFATYQVAILVEVKKNLPSRGTQAIVNSMRVHLKSLQPIIAGINPTLIPSDGMAVYAGLISISHEIADLADQAGAHAIGDSAFSQQADDLLDEAHKLWKLTEERIEKKSVFRRNKLDLMRLRKS